jgi:Transposase, Mutator family
VSPVGDEPAMRDWAAELVERACSEGVELTGDNGLLTALVRQVVQTGLEVEMTDHLGYEPHAAVGRGSGNNGNGHYPKTVKTEIGEVDLRCRGTATRASPGGSTPGSPSSTRSPSTTATVSGPPTDHDHHAR